MRRNNDQYGATVVYSLKCCLFKIVIAIATGAAIIGPQRASFHKGASIILDVTICLRHEAVRQDRFSLIIKLSSDEEATFIFHF